jgi:ribosomal RNA assembly protein
MKEIFVDDLRKIKKFKNKVEKALNVKLTIDDKISIESKADDAFSEYMTERVLEALSFNFKIGDALKLKDEDYMFEKINIKSYARQSRWKTVLGRLIGKRGKAIKTFSMLSDCSIQIKDYDVALIGSAEDMDLAMLALMKLIRGSPHAKVYAFLERNRVLKRIERNEDLGLKEEK